jgi:hypothetical protein
MVTIKSAEMKRLRFEVNHMLETIPARWYSLSKKYEPTDKIWKEIANHEMRNNKDLLTTALALAHRFGDAHSASDITSAFRYYQMVLKRVYRDGASRNVDHLVQASTKFFREIELFLVGGFAQEQRDAGQNRAYANLRNEGLSLMAVAERGRISELVGKYKKFRRTIEAYMKQYRNAGVMRSYLRDYDRILDSGIMRELARTPDRKDLRKFIAQSIGRMVTDLNPI